MKNSKLPFKLLGALILFISLLQMPINADESSVTKDITINKILKYNTSSANNPILQLSTYFYQVGEDETMLRHVVGSNITYKNQDKYRLNKVYTAYTHAYSSFRYYGQNNVSVPLAWNNNSNKFVLPAEINSVLDDSTIATNGYGVKMKTSDKSNFQARPKHMFTQDLCDSASKLASLNNDPSFDIKEPACAPLESEILSLTLFDKSQNIKTNESNVYLETEKLPGYIGDGGVWYAFTVGAYLHIDYDFDISVTLNNPQNQHVKQGQSAQFNTVLTFNGDSNPGELFWEVSTDGGENYTKVDGATTETLNISDVNASQEDNLYRAGFKAQSDSEVEVLYTEPAKLTLEKSVVNYNTNIAELNINASEVFTGSTLTELPQLEYKGLIFEGWFVDQELTVQFDIMSSINTNIELYARWNTRNKENVNVSVVDTNGLTVEGYEITLRNISNENSVVSEGKPTTAFSLYSDFEYSFSLTLTDENYTINPQDSTQVLENGFTDTTIVFVVKEQFSPTTPEVPTPEVEAPQITPPSDSNNDVDEESSDINVADLINSDKEQQSVLSNEVTLPSTGIASSKIYGLSGAMILMGIVLTLKRETKR